MAKFALMVLVVGAAVADSCLAVKAAMDGVAPMVEKRHATVLPEFLESHRVVSEASRQKWHILVH